MKKLISLPAHYDGENIILDTPFELKLNDKLLVTVLSSSDESDDKSEWLNASINQLNRAYTEEEPQYSQAMIKESNPEYKK